jgi:squalene synthase HpnC
MWVTRDATHTGGTGATGAASESARLIGAEAGGKAANENFPVALRFLPARYRHHLAAVYGFARSVDDMGDEAPPGERLALLTELEADIRRLYRRSGGRDAGEQEGGAGDSRKDGSAPAAGGSSQDGPAPAAPGGSSQDGPAPAASGTGPATFSGSPARAGGPVDGDGGPRLPVVRALAPAVAECAIPAQPFLDLIEANRQDQTVTRYQTFPDLLGYCRLSANPVGLIVLHVFRAATPAREASSDLVCTALQIAEHLQDVAEDLRAGRIYLPGEDLDAFGCTEDDLAAPSAGPRVRALIEFQVRRASSLLDEGAPIVGTLRGAARAAVAGYVAGGRAALAAIAASGYDPLSATPRPRKAKVAAELVRAYATGK